MNPGKFDLNMYRGDTYSWRFILWTNANKTEPVDLASAIVELEIKDKPSNPVAAVSVPCTVTLPNVVDISMTPVMYANCPSKGVWDMQITFPDGQVQTPIGGSVVLTQDVTKSTPLVARRGDKHE